MVNLCVCCDPLRTFLHYVFTLHDVLHCVFSLQRVFTLGYIISEHHRSFAKLYEFSKDQQQTEFKLQYFIQDNYILFETTIFIGNSNSISSKRHCSVISIHALRGRIL